jgi:predicted metal-dependent enzyme (double-stranded beta helix superfamily)
MVELDEGQREILFIGRDLMSRLVARDLRLPAAFAQAGGVRVIQLYQDGMERFSLVSLVLPPGQATAITEQPFWHIFGVLRGAILRRRFDVGADGRVVVLDETRLGPGAVEGAKAGGFTQWINPNPENSAILIQVHGGEIGKTPRRAFAANGEETLAATGYDNPVDAPPYDIWGIQTRIED